MFLLHHFVYIFLTLDLIQTDTFFTLLSYYKILYVLSVEVVHVWKSDCAVNTNFPLPPFQRSVAWEGREGGTGEKNSHGGKGIWGEGVRGKNYLPPPSWVVLSTTLSVLTKKQKLKIDCNFQFLDFRRKQKN